MKKIVAVLSLLAASAFAQAQGLNNHPDARNDRMPSASAAERSNGHAYRRAEHRKMKRHHRHHRKAHHKM